MNADLNSPSIKELSARLIFRKLHRFCFGNTKTLGTGRNVRPYRRGYHHGHCNSNYRRIL